MITFELPRLPPSTNQLFIEVEGDTVMHHEGGKVVMKARPRKRVKAQPYRQWRDEMGWEVKRQVRKSITGPVAIVLELHRTYNQRCDLDNRIKGILDLMVEMKVIEDDSLVQELTARWVNQGPQVLVQIVPWTDPLDPSEPIVL